MTALDPSYDGTLESVGELVVRRRQADTIGDGPLDDAIGDDWTERLEFMDPEVDSS